MPLWPMFGIDLWKADEILGILTPVSELLIVNNTIATWEPHQPVNRWGQCSLIIIRCCNKRGKSPPVLLLFTHAMESLYRHIVRWCQIVPDNVDILLAGIIDCGGKQCWTSVEDAQVVRTKTSQESAVALTYCCKLRSRQPTRWIFPTLGHLAFSHIFFCCPSFMTSLASPSTDYDCGLLRSRHDTDNIVNLLLSTHCWPGQKSMNRPGFLPMITGLVT